jgi:protein-S-isoprenylcysteine O-methyltransferase Ste14
MNTILRFIAGYLIGAFLFLLVIPYGFFEMSRLDHLNGYMSLFNSNGIRTGLSGLLLVTGLFFALWSNVFLLFVGKGGPVDAFGVSISPQTKKLVTRGPYRYSRNPMVFGALCVYGAVVVFMNSLFGLIALILLTTGAVLYLRLSEEKRLIRDFGDEYLQYRKKVAMIVPLLKFYRKI